MTKRMLRLIISQIILGTLKGLKMEYPRLSGKQRKELRAMRQLLVR